jgi:hypothetical protein
LWFENFFYKDNTNNRVICKICKGIHAHKKGKGMRILDRHIKRIYKDWYKNLLKQSQIQTIKSQVVDIIQYKHRRIRNEVAKFIVKTISLFGFLETPHFKKLMHVFLQPTYKKIFKIMLRSTIIKL